jgi:hypothetical protein
LEDIFDLLLPRSFFKNQDGVLMSPLTNEFEHDEVRKELVRYLADHRDFEILCFNYKKGERIDKASNRTAFLKNPDILMGIDKKYFPEITSRHDELGAKIAAYLSDDHVYTCIRIENKTTKKFRNFVWRICPMEICYEYQTRNIFFNISKLVILKRTQGASTEDREQMITHIFSHETFKDFQKTNVGQLKEKIDKEGYVVYGVMTDGLATLPFHGMFILMERVLGYSLSTCHYDKTIMMDRLINGITQGEGRELAKFFQRDLDYCNSCIKYSQ